MTIRREDLTAAAAVGLLNYRQIEPLLVFLLQRDVRAQREEMLAQMRPSPFRRLNRWLAYLLALLALLTVGLFAVLFATHALQAKDVGALALVSGLYGVGALALAGWFRRRGFCARVRVLAAVMVASVPFAVLALQHISV